MTKTTLALAIAVFLALVGCQPEAAKTEPGSSDTKPTATTGASTSSEPDVVPDDLKPTITDIKAGTGLVAEPGDLLVVNYKGTFKDGKEFDSNLGADKNPYSFILGQGTVISGWDRGLAGMKVGGKRKLEVPYLLAYGSQGNDRIPPKSDLIFEVDLIYVVKKDAQGDYDSKDIKVGTGPEVKNGDKVKVHYTGTFLNGKKFDSSKDRNQPFEITVGAGEVIKGWEVGLIGMKKGGVRELILPPALAYGESGNQGIPGNSVLKFEIELLEIVK